MRQNVYRVGAAVPDVRLAQAAASAGIAGLAFYRGIPGTVGGALRMNAGAHGGETKDVLVERALSTAAARSSLRQRRHRLHLPALLVPDDQIFTRAILEGRRGDPAEIAQEMKNVAEYREANQPVKSRTGGSTFKNPPGHSAWKLIDAAGCRGLRVGGAHMSQMHCNFLINDQGATAADVEHLGETVRERVFSNGGIMLEWEIKRIGVPGAENKFAAAE